MRQIIVFATGSILYKDIAFPAGTVTGPTKELIEILVRSFGHLNLEILEFVSDFVLRISGLSGFETVFNR